MFPNDSMTALDALDTMLAEEADRINGDVHANTLHVSPWIDLVPQMSFPEGMGYRLSTLVYDRAIPAKGTGDGAAQGVNWHDIAVTEASNTFNTSQSTGRNPLADSVKQTAGPSGGDLDGDGDLTEADTRAFLNFSKQLKPYTMRRATIETPRISLEDLRFAAHRDEQLRAVMDLMTEATRYTWEERYRDEYDRLAANFVPVLATGTSVYTTIDVSASTKFEGVQTVDVDLNNDFVSSGVDVDLTPTGNISNAVMDKLYFRLVRKGAGTNAYGRENSRPIFAAVLSSEASRSLIVESGFRDDIRYNNARVDELIQPLGVEKGFRGFYHLIDDLAPRYTVATGALTRVYPYSITIASGQFVTLDNPAYETASYEALHILHKEVMCSQVPNPFAGAKDVKFDPTTYRGQFKWTNIKHERLNPDGHVGFFRGIFASASKPIKTDFGYVVLFKRDSTTPGA